MSLVADKNMLVTLLSLKVASQHLKAACLRYCVMRSRAVSRGKCLLSFMHLHIPNKAASSSELHLSLRFVCEQ